ncbi:hypothetical protein BS50DRAFT_398410 [Corynespora cassiicola Philippines]|uniref:Transglutaminase-like domain-containing protein n=1 Tax=Corynespora cassiicola Philippines TaxID=1448308 RepID=A0A2T2NK75_CORCC|nr:hypothetical protein BS50DRAFT_398410 [Corynespora cassiicola Philippines]
MAEQQQQGPVLSLKDRIAALNIEQVHVPAPNTKPSYNFDHAAAKKKPPPPPPSQKPPSQRQNTVNNPPLLNGASTSQRQLGNQPARAVPPTPKISPALPPRPPPRTNSSTPKPPSLPPRKSSEHSLKRRESSESISTINSGISSLSIGSAKTAGSNGQLYQVRAPAFDPTKLPPLPPKRVKEEPKPSRAQTLKAMRSASNLSIERTLPPKLPSRPPLPVRQESQPQKQVDNEKPKIIPPPRRSALEFGMNKATETPPPVPTTRPSANPAPAPAPVPEAGAPPPVPLSSRPNLDAIMASKPKPGARGTCLKCRDFSAPDKHAAQFPRQTLPSSDVGWLASQLTSPFSSATDKARVIFTWLHHNIEYDTHTFFSGTCSGSTPERTITSGLAVCSGYAGLFSALALKAGLESVVIGGHGKGYGHAALKPGDPIPPYSAGHAWNAVQIDHGEWKLIDTCWGAGNVQGPNQPYQKSFKAYWFTMDNNEFGASHFPEDARYLFRTDGRAMSWEEYIMDDMGERVTVYTPATPDHGLGARTFEPKLKHIKVHDPHNGPSVRFSFANVCAHWDNEKHGKGKPYVMVLNIGGRDGRKTEWVPFNTDGRVYWLDVNRIDLGCPGQKVSVFAVTSINGKDGRGMSYADYKSKQGRVAMGFGGVAVWELA